MLTKMQLSHHEHAKLHKAVLKKTAGFPAFDPSPCIDSKISLTFMFILVELNRLKNRP